MAVAKAKEAEYRKALRSLRADLKALYRQRDDLERRIARLRQTVLSLGALCGEDHRREYLKGTIHGYESLTEAVTSTILTSTRPIPVKEIRDILKEIGYEIQSSNPLASIHSVLKRLWQQKRIHVAYRRHRTGPHAGKIDVLHRFFWYVDDSWRKPPKDFAVMEGWYYLPGQTDEQGNELKKQPTKKNAETDE